VWLDAPADVLRERVQNRTGDASDATVEVVDAQGTRNPGQITWHHIDAAQSVQAVLNSVRGIL
jgi:predicted kinase